MITIQKKSDLNLNIDNNTIIFSNDQISFESSTICFDGKYNTLIIEDGTQILNSYISFRGNNSVIYLSKATIRINAIIYSLSEIYIGKDSAFNCPLTLYCFEGKSIYIGSGCLFAPESCLSTGDSHLIYSAISHKRINHANNIIIGDHVWIGQHCNILKGSYIGSGSVIGCQSVVSNKKIESCSVYAGNPCKKINSNILWSSVCCNDLIHPDLDKHETLINHDYYYEKDTTSLDFDEVSIQKLTNCNDLTLFKNRLSV